MSSCQTRAARQRQIDADVARVADPNTCTDDLHRRLAAQVHSLRVDLDTARVASQQIAEWRTAEQAERARLQRIVDTAQALVDAWDDDRNVDEVFDELRALLPPTPAMSCPGPIEGHGCDECRSDQELHPGRYQ